MCNENRGCVDKRTLGVGNILSSVISSQNRLNGKRMHNIPLLKGSVPQYNRSSHSKNSFMALQSMALFSSLSQLPSFYYVRMHVWTHTFPSPAHATENAPKIDLLILHIFRQVYSCKQILWLRKASFQALENKCTRRSYQFRFPLQRLTGF